MVCTLIGVTQAHTALDFSLYYMWSMVFLYGVVIVHTISR